MSPIGERMIQGWKSIGPRFLPFADVASADLPLSRLLRLSLFQVSVGMAVVLLNGTLNRVMIVELGVPTWLVALMVALPLVFAPARALIGHRSDNYRSALGWRRVPYLWMGTMLQFGGFAIMPFALLLLSGDTTGPLWIGWVAAGLAFLLVGFGMHMAQTAGLALATDLAPADKRPRVVALLYVTLLAGMFVSALAYGLLLSDFSQLRLIQVLQGTAMVTVAINLIALWKQEPRNPALTGERPRESFGESWRRLMSNGKAKRALIAVALGTAAFSMQDMLLEPYGGEILKLSVSGTTTLTALLAAGSLVGFAVAARALSRNADPYRLAALGALWGLPGFSAVIFADPLHSVLLFRIGTTLIGFGGGLFAVAMLTAAMDMADRSASGIALGAWGAVQATSAGVAIAIGGALRDVVTAIASQGHLGPTLAMPSVGYTVVYHVELLLLFATLVALGPLVRPYRDTTDRPLGKIGLAEFPT